MKMEYDRKKLEMEERVTKAKTRAKVMSTFGDVSLQKYKKEDQFLTGKDNRKNKKAPLLRKDPVFHKNETKIENQKFSHQSTLNYDWKEFIPGNNIFLMRTISLMGKFLRCFASLYNNKVRPRLT